MRTLRGPQTEPSLRTCIPNDRTPERRVPGRPWALLALGISILLPFAVAAGDMKIFGLQHSPLGNATFAVDSQGNLIVSNLGSSGKDGYRVDVGETLGVLPRLEASPQGLPLGAVITSETRGQVDGLPDQTAGIMVTEGVGGGRVQVGLDFSAIGASTYTLRVLREGQVVYEASGVSGRAATFQPSGIDYSACCALFFYYVYIGFDTFIDTESGEKVLGDMVTFEPDDPSRNLEFISSVSIRTQGLESVTVGATGLAVFDPALEHFAVGDVTLEASGGTLDVGDIDASGNEGVSIDIASPLGKTTEWVIDTPMMLDPSALPSGVVSTREVIGLDGDAEVIISQATVESLDHSIRFNAMFDTVASPARTVRFFVGETLVGEVVDYEGPGVEIAGAVGVIKEKYKFRRDGSMRKCVITYDASYPAQIDGFAGLADTIEFIPQDPLILAEPTTVRITGSAPPKIQILGETLEVETTLFSDGFESGDALGWSTVFP